MSTEDNPLEGVAKTLLPIDIKDEMRTSYMDYSMSVIIGRALPDVRDGLKPVHRRILYAMYREGLLSNRKYSKCAGVVGEVLKKYHPHGDSAVYDALVRMAQPWNMRYLLVDGQGNFGSVDGDSAAAYRYTESRMKKFAEEYLADIDKETVRFTPNFDGQVLEPEVLPTRVPGLLCNGSDGIAVGMATKIPPHNIGEVINGTIALIDDPNLDSEQLMTQFIPGPDFPTGGFIYGRKGIHDAYTTGRGRVIMRGRTHFEEFGNDRERIVIDELPFQVNKARLLQQIAELVKEKKVEGISALRDESDRRGMRVVVELKRDAFPEVVLNKIFKHTELQSTFGVIMLAIVHGQPKVLTLKEMLSHFLAHRREVTTRRCRYELRKARERAHILEGLRIALDNLDEVIALIRASKTAEIAREGLMERFELSKVQAQAILDMRLQRLVGLEREKIENEYDELMKTIERLLAILGSEALLMEVIREELVEVRDTYGDERRTEIVDSGSELSIRDLIAEEEQVVALSVNGYIKRMPLDLYKEQRRGGHGLAAMKTREEDSVRDIFIGNTHDDLLVFTTHGWVYKVPVYEIPQANRGAKGRPLVNLVQLEPDDTVATVITARGFEESTDLLFVSRKGLVKRTNFGLFKNLRSNGLRSYDCAEGDELFMVRKTSPEQEVLIATAQGLAIRFRGTDVRSMGRIARGVRGIDLQENDWIVSMEILEKDDEKLLLTVTEKGFGKRTSLTEYRLQNRGGKGIINIRTGERNGHVVGSVQVADDDKVMLITNTGRIIKTRVHEVRETGRAALGVTLMRVAGDEAIVGVTRVVEDDEEEVSSEETEGVTEAPVEASEE
ncbi:MAG: DNA gyrase subunit A [Myxococcota bacterium]|nr:DNA gyrase subunit A [Myxococcota bacterium]